ncbi:MULTISPECIES: ACT domain-containing protein [Maribacter]|mgnify:CR=1 FL=1|uniref:ACT domain-containing protein n=1 Tax=Maribacter TaxID=252356 RepID=UPI00047BADA0|nr:MULTISPECIES: ACT domain-containing protein [Maribacter]|tara:strand:- start:444 stop:836 length:393 start_codon:yes stop_codon:yes gene_type:complete
MSGEKNLDTLLKSMKPKHNVGEFVFCKTENLEQINLSQIIMSFKEEESITIIAEKAVADKLDLDYSFIASWITLTVHSSLEAVGLTAAFSKALSENGISCNVVAAYYHDHIFIDQKDTEKAMAILNEFSK